MLLLGALVDKFGDASNKPLYTLTCSSSESDPSDCTATPAPDSCDHSMDLGVRCLTHQEAYRAVVKKLRMCESEITASTSNANDCDDSNQGSVSTIIELKIHGSDLTIIQFPQ